MRIKSNILAAVAAVALAGAGSAPARSRLPGEGASRAARRHERRRAEAQTYYRDASFPDDSRQVRRRAQLKSAKRVAAQVFGDRGAWREVRAQWLALGRSESPSRREDAPTRAAGKRAARTPASDPVRAAQSGAGR